MGSVDVFASVIKMISALAVILGIMIAATYGLKRVVNRTGPGLADDGPIRILSTRYIGPKSSVMVMEVLDRLIVIGISNQQMTLLTTISDPGVVEKMKGAAGQGRRPGTLTDHFMSYRTRWMSGLSEKGKKENG